MYAVVYHTSVVQGDIPKISKPWQVKIRTAIEKRLTTRPDYYGKPLRRSLSGYRKLRVGDYRVIFRIEANLVRILIIGHRSIVYKDVSKRI